MGTLIVLRGISGSGKSTWSAAYKVNHPYENVLIVNRDKIRALCFGSEDAYGVDEWLVTQIQNTMIVKGIYKDYTVILDDTNIEVQYIKDIINLTPDLTPVEVINMPLDLERAILLNGTRERKVPEEVIRNQYVRLLETDGWRPL